MHNRFIHYFIWGSFKISLLVVCFSLLFHFSFFPEGIQYSAETILLLIDAWKLTLLCKMWNKKYMLFLVEGWLTYHIIPDILSAFWCILCTIDLPDRFKDLKSLFILLADGHVPTGYFSHPCQSIVLFLWNHLKYKDFFSMEQEYLLIDFTVYGKKKSADVWKEWSLRWWHKGGLLLVLSTNIPCRVKRVEAVSKVGCCEWGGAESEEGPLRG